MTFRRVHALVIAFFTTIGLVVFTQALFSAGQKTVHVNGYTKKDGTVVKLYDRKALGSSTKSTPAPSSTAPAQAQQVQPSTEQPSLSVVFVVAGAPATALYHRALCPWLKASGAIISTHTAAEADKRYFQPHCLCMAGHDGVPPCQATSATATPVPRPLTAEIPQATSRLDPKHVPAPSSQTALAAETVYVTKTGGKYHRAGCRFLSKSAMPIALKDAASHYSPCSVCKPPTASK